MRNVTFHPVIRAALTLLFCFLIAAPARSGELLKQSTARNRVVLMIDSTDHVTGKTGLTLTITASKDGAALASITPTVTELANGLYSLALTTTHTNTTGDFAMHITSTGADPTDIVDQVVTLLPGDAVTVGTNNDKTGYSLTVTPPTAGTIASAVWQDTTAGDFTTALSVGKSVMNGVALGTGLTINSYTGNTPQTGDNYSRLGAPSGASIDADILTRMATYTQPTGFLAASFPSGTVANTTNITAGTLTTVTTATNLTTNNDKTGYTLTVTPPTAATIASAVWQDTTTGDFTTALSVGKSVMNGVTLGTGLTINSYTGNTPQTGDSFARLGAPSGASIDADILTRSTYAGGDTSGTTTLLARLTSTRAGLLDNLDAAISSRSTYAGADTSGTTTLLTRLPSALTITGGKIDVNDKTGFSLSSGGVQAIWDALTSVLTTVGSIGKLFVTDIDTTVSSRMATYTQPTGFLAAAFPSGTVANTTNITAGTLTTVTTATNLTTNNDKTGYSLAANQHVIVDSGTVTTLTNLPSIPTNWLTASGITAGALNGKGDWLLSSSYTVPPSAATIAAQVTTDHGSGSYIRNTEPDNASAAAAAANTANFQSLIENVSGWRFNTHALMQAPSAIASDPLAVTLPGSYTGKQAGALIYRVATKP